MQRRWFAAQLELAVELDMPVFLHERDARDDFLAILRDYRADLPRAVVHCFTGTRETLEAYLALSIFISASPDGICDGRRGAHLRELGRRHSARSPDDRDRRAVLAARAICRAT